MCAEPNAGPLPEAQAIGHIGQRVHGGVLTCGLSREGSAHSQGRMRMRAFNGADKRAALFSSVMQSASLVASMVFGRLGESGAATDGARNSARSEVESSQPVPARGVGTLRPQTPALHGYAVTSPKANASTLPTVLFGLRPNGRRTNTE